MLAAVLKVCKTLCLSGVEIGLRSATNLELHVGVDLQFQRGTNMEFHNGANLEFQVATNLGLQNRNVIMLGW